MAEQAGQIHGLITREQAWEMWAPYGSRITDELDGTLDPESVTPVEAINIARGAHPYYRYELLDSTGYYDSDQAATAHWARHIGNAVEAGASEELVELLAEANDHQNAVVGRRREWWINNGGRFVAKVGNAIQTLADQGEVFTPEQADLVKDRLLGPDGTPYLQYTPMTQLEYSRLYTHYDKEVPDPFSASYCTDFSLGIIASGERLTNTGTQVSKHNRAHEQVHGSVAGVEIYDITRDDGWRRPVATVAGLMVCPISTEVESGTDFSGTENVEVNEAWTDAVGQEIMRVGYQMKTYPLPPSQSTYSTWVGTFNALKAEKKDVIKEMTRVSLIDASPENPDEKREEVTRLKAFADSAYDETNVLDKLFGSSVRIADLHPRPSV